MTRITDVLSTSERRLAAAVREACSAQWHESVKNWSVQGRWKRLHSEVQLLEVNTSRATYRMIAKRSNRATVIGDQRLDEGLALHEFHALREAEQAVAALAHAGVPRAYWAGPGDDWCLMEYVSGAELDRQLAGARRFARLKHQAAAELQFERLGEWLRVYQSATRRNVDFSQIHGTLDELQLRLDLLAHQQQHTSPEWMAKVTHRLRWLEREIVEPIEGCSCHGDFGPWNVIVSDDRLTVLDFSCQRDDSVWIDVLNVLTYLQSQLASVTLDRRRLLRLQDAFLVGYRRRLDEQDPVYQLSLISRQLCRLQDAVSSVFGSWGDRYRRRRVICQLTDELQKSR